MRYARAWRLGRSAAVNRSTSTLDASAGFTAPLLRYLRWAKSLIDSDVSPNGKLVGLVCILTWANRRTLAGIRPGAPLLSRTTGLSVRLCYRALSELVNAGYLVKEKSGHYGSATLYRGTFPRGNKVAKNAKADTVKTELEPFVCAICGEAGAEQATGRPVCVNCASPKG